jgi:hypothetical protein
LFNISLRAGGAAGVRGGMAGGGRTGGAGGGGGFGGGGGMPGGGGFAGAGGRMQISLQGRGMEASDIAKIVYLGPHETKRIGVIQDAQPRSVMINTLISQNIPGEITLSIDKLNKSADNIKQFSGEELVTSGTTSPDSDELDVDNEDPGFKVSAQNTGNRLKNILGIQNKNGETYQQLSLIRIPSFWQPIVQSIYFGKYIRSAVYTKAGTGDKILTWATVIPKAGYYDVFTYIGKTADRMMIMGGPGGRQGGGQGGAGGGRQGAGTPSGGGRSAAGGPGGAGGMQGPGGPGGTGGQGREGFAGLGQPTEPYKDFHYSVYHDGGVETVNLDYTLAESGWNKLGTYYLKADTAKVILSNLSTGRVVIGDAVKWVRQKQ